MSDVDEAAVIGKAQEMLERPTAVESLNGLAARNGRVENPLRCLSTTELRTLPPVAWLIDRVLVAFAFVVLYGPSGVGKSFLALDLALTVASGAPWLDGSPTTGGWVLYIAAEGAAGLTRRIDSWCQERGLPEPERIRWMPDAVNLLDAATVAHAVERINEMPEPPALLVIDTMARSMVDGDENSARDVGRFVAAVDQLRAAANNATALVIHHTGKKGDDERGSSSLRGASDQMMLMADTGNGLRLEHRKLKDFDAPKPIDMHLAEPGELGASSAVRLGRHSGGLTQKGLQLLHVCHTVLADDEVSNTRLMEVLEWSESQFQKVIAPLREAGYITTEPRGRERWNRITALGIEKL